MTKIPLSPKRLRRLEREARGSSHAFRQLCREAVAREWLKREGIPSLGNPEPPPPEFSTASARYAMMLDDGSRFMICRAADAVFSFDSVAAAKCFAVLAVSMDKGCVSGEPSGYVLLSDMDPGIHRVDFTCTGHRTPASFLDLVGPGGRYLPRLLKMSARLLILGEPEVPTWGAANARTFNVYPDRRREV